MFINVCSNVLGIGKEEEKKIPKDHAKWKGNDCKSTDFAEVLAEVGPEAVEDWHSSKTEAREWDD